jgi:prepilin-type N-terminal cleavage/methylation domain-containing protein
MKRECRQRHTAFTLAEVMIAIAVTGVAFASLYLSISQSFATWQRSRERMRGNQILLEKLDVIRVYNWTQINTPGFIPSTFTEYYKPSTNGIGAGVAYKGTMTVTTADVSPSYSNTIRRVVATLKWDRGGITNKLQMETFVSRHGIQNFVY